MHVTPYAWASAELRRPILRLVRQGRITAVELDLKDESGIVGYDSQVKLARRIGATRGLYDLGKAVRRLHGLGARVVGRLVCFRDPVLAREAWRRGHRDWVIQTPDRRPYSAYGGYTNFASSAVHDYNIDIATEAARAGVDEILYDYVRRPEGKLTEMRIPHLRGKPEAAITAFLAESSRRLRPLGTQLGASVFGVAASRPWTVAQDILEMAEHVDYIAPMVYPSHWSRGEYGVAHPEAQPYRIVLRSLRHFKRKLRGSAARLVPWLQDFSLAIPYGKREVRAQIEAARRLGIEEWILWDPEVTYTARALPRRPKRS